MHPDGTSITSPRTHSFCACWNGWMNSVPFQDPLGQVLGGGGGMMSGIGPSFVPLIKLHWDQPL